MTDFDKCKVGDIVLSTASGLCGRVLDKDSHTVLVGYTRILRKNVKLVHQFTLGEAKVMLENAGYTVTDPVVIPKFGQMYTYNKTGAKALVVTVTPTDVYYVWEGRTAPTSEPLPIFNKLFTLDN